jgi:hypothetical protein
MANPFLRRFPAAVAAIAAAEHLPLAVLGGKKRARRLPLVTDRRAGTFAPATTAAHLTAVDTRAAPATLSTTANDAVNRAPARGLVGEIAKRVTVGEAVAAPTTTVVEAVLSPGLASAAVRSVSFATSM